MERERPPPWNEFRRSAAGRTSRWLLAADWSLRVSAAWLSRSSFIAILEYLGRFSVVVALVVYVFECDDRRRARHFQAWSIVRSAEHQPERDLALVEAIELLAADGVNLANVDLHAMMLPNADLRGAVLMGANLDRVRMNGADLSGGLLANARLESGDLTMANLSDVWAKETDFRLARLLGASLRGAILRGADLRGADLEGADLRDADLSGAKLSRAKLKGVRVNEGTQMSPKDRRLVEVWGGMRGDFTDADLSRAWLRGVELRGADLRRANLEGSELDDADLRDADLREANLNHVRFIRADLRGAQLSGASVVGASFQFSRLEGVDVSETKGKVEWESACFDEATKPRLGVEPPSACATIWPARGEPGD